MQGTRDEEREYPSSDGRPMAETDFHRDEMIYLIQAIRFSYQHVQDVYVSGNLLLYYVEGDRRAAVAPDVFVVKGVEKRLRRCFLLWKEGRAPCFVIEVTSEETREEDIAKKDLYEQLGVEEYFIHDRLAEYLEPPLQGYRMHEGSYRRITPEADGSLISYTTGFRLLRVNERLRVFDVAVRPLRDSCCND
jgi:Uma2 family endonuclease